MKKIININLSGRVIPIEDTAYEKLQDYIESLRRYFAQEDGRDEIINDIPNVSVITQIEVLGFNSSSETDKLLHGFFHDATILGLTDKVVDKTI